MMPSNPKSASLDHAGLLTARLPSGDDGLDSTSLVGKQAKAGKAKHTVYHTARTNDMPLRDTVRGARAPSTLSAPAYGVEGLCLKNTASNRR
jgi:hypothetical protein